MIIPKKTGAFPIRKTIDQYKESQKLKMKHIDHQVRIMLYKLPVS